MKDIENREDIRILIDEFYKKVVADELIGHFFTEVVRLDWDKHIPTMYDFWETTLLGNLKYKGNPMIKHIELNKKESLNSEHFDRWLALWEDTLKKHFMGAKAEEALKRARQIAELMKFKVRESEKWK